METGRVMLAVVAAAALVSFVAPPYPDLVLMQNVPTLIAVAVLWRSAIALPRYVTACICAFLLLHTLGGRYAYSYVPYDDWMRALGLPTVSEVTGVRRNGYDRLVHLSFGLLAVHPVERLARRWDASPRLALYMAVEFVLALSCLYEIFEWLLTVVMANPADADLYNGQQGDPWDAQKDMACATVGAAMSSATIAIRRLLRSRRTS